LLFHATLVNSCRKLWERMIPNLYSPPPPKTSRGVIALVLGILSVVGFGLIAGIPAWVIGRGVIKDMDAGLEDPSDRSIAMVGKVLGIVTTLLSGFVILIMAPLIFGLMGGVMKSNIDQIAVHSNQEDGIYRDASKGRKSILEAAITERKKHPQKDYRTLVKELEKGHVKWYSLPIKPPSACGEYSFDGDNGMLMISDSCGSSTLYGWPPKASY